MLVSIGRRQRSDDLLDLLMACHARIRAFSALAVALGERASVAPAEVVDACDRVTRYFTEALPLHARDEEEDLLPRLAGRSPALDAALGRLRDEHQEHEPLLRELLSRCASVRASPGDDALRASVTPAAVAVRDAFEAHLLGEERDVFPAVREALSEGERGELVASLRARRSVAAG